MRRKMGIPADSRGGAIGIAGDSRRGAIQRAAYQIYRAIGIAVDA